MEMKEITAYFSSPIKKIEDKPNAEASISTVRKTKKNEYTETTCPNRRKKREKRSSEKHRKSDPAVGNVTELFSNSLSIVSPNNQNMKTVNMKEIIVIDEVVKHSRDVKNSLVIEDDLKTDTPKNNGQIPNKPNAFQFMMDSRHKSIGTNSPGKELHDQEETDDTVLKKSKLAARKNILNNWAEHKGGAKRKRADEELGEIINHKLKKRAKRLRKLLKVDPIQQKVGAEDIRKSNRKRIASIPLSSSESENDFEVTEIKNGKLKTDLKSSINGTLSEIKIKDNSNISHSTEEDKKKSHGKSIKVKPKKCIESDQNISATAILKKITQKPDKRYRKAKKKVLISSSVEYNKVDVGKEKGSTSDEDILEKNPQRRKHKKRKKRPEKDTDKSSQEINSAPPHNSSLDGNIDDGENGDTCTILSSDGDENLISKEMQSRNSKIAPVFARATPKPKEDPTIVEARRQFLLSGIPSSLKKVKEKQQSIEDKEYNVFPSISHVQQKCEGIFWQLPDPNLNIKETSPLEINVSYQKCKGITKGYLPEKLNIKTELEKIDKLKVLLNKIKADNPNYPVYKSFRSIYEKSGKIPEGKSKKKQSPKKGRKSKKKKLKGNCEIVDVPILLSESNIAEHSMWTDKYKPNCSDDIIGNFEAVRNLKKWLDTWMKYSQEINSRSRKRTGSSGSDFETTDCDSRDSTTLPGNTVVLGGPCGSGKSTAVYAICNELGFNVIELNASSKRTGKRLLQELQEATQSHQVRKTNSQFFEKNRNKKAEDTDGEIKKMCVLLIEDIDVVFEQDDGFISALTQVVSTSKRPIILTTTDYDSVFMQKFLNQYEYIPFLSLSSHSLATWLQIVCLVEGVFVLQDDIGSLLEFNKGDVRKTLLQLQFWVLSGGQIFQNDLPVKAEDKRSSCDEKLVDDEEPNDSLVETCTENDETIIHQHCFGSFEIFSIHEPFAIPYYLNLGMLWWNIPNIIDLPNVSRQRVQKFRKEPQAEKINITMKKCKLSHVDKLKLNSAVKLYDALLFTDIMFRKVDYLDGFEPIVKNVNSRISNSLELGEDFILFSGDIDFVHEVTHSLVNGHIREYNRIDEGQSKLDMAVPNRTERRWRAKNHVCEDIFQDALCVSNKLERKSSALDYMPVLRNIFRSECVRATNNTKRGNRFRNYLKDLGVNCYGNTVKLACNIMRETD
ncbi:hypothetical protein JTB14_010953 [Gonioctena quinquepunctata]|nr:hypothetical protein JTB14_010953 [Gonioctena quinquepunctata]